MSLFCRPKQILAAFCLLLPFSFQALSAQTVEESMRQKNDDQFLFPLHKSNPTPPPQDSGAIEDGRDENAGEVIEGSGTATIENSEGDSETVAQNPNSPNGTVVRGKDGKVVAFVDSASSPGINRISDPRGNVLGTISESASASGYQIKDQYGHPIGSIDKYGQVYNFYDQGIGTVPPGGSAADLFAAWTLLKERR
ncbi:hypothetical protein FAI40_04255 [Acetobacteraceae bacterium]|nr:hypothetical protein FAI40_04255 [Acetobacteraceae bacterium]